MKKKSHPPRSHCRPNAFIGIWIWISTGVSHYSVNYSAFWSTKTLCEWAIGGVWRFFASVISVFRLDVCADSSSGSYSYFGCDYDSSLGPLSFSIGS